MDAPRHSRAFRLRRFANWFPLGITYACLYMGRYNFNVVKGTMGEMFHMDKTQMANESCQVHFPFLPAALLREELGGTDEDCRNEDTKL